MTRAGKASAVVVLAALCLVVALPRTDAEWKGVDDTVVNVAARAAGRSPLSPLVDPSRGDLGLFLFLMAGAAGGFLAGYTFRGLSHPDRKDR